jgi:hypothetical protein
MTVTQQMSLPLSGGISESGSLMSPLVELSVSSLAPALDQDWDLEDPGQ